jgi:hypothetical protein
MILWAAFWVGFRVGFRAVFGAFLGEGFRTEGMDRGRDAWAYEGSALPRGE